MIYSYTPDRQKKTGTAVAFLCFFAALILLFPMLGNDTVINIVRSLAPVCVLVGLLVIDRLVLTVYTYALGRDDKTGEVLFEVTKRHGRRLTVVCRIAARDICAVKDASGGEGSYRAPKDTVRYSYCPALPKKERTALLVSDGDGECVVFISADERLRDLLGSFSSEKKDKR